MRLFFCSIAYHSRLGVSYFMLMHDTAEGLIAIQSRGHPSNDEKRKRLLCPNFMTAAVEELRRDLRLSAESKILLMLSCATDEMIQIVSMHPEV